MLNLTLVAIGGAVGSMSRYAVAVASVRFFGPGVPAGTLFVNVTGSFLIGLGAELIARRYGGSAEMRLFLLTGVLGGYTTFSAFSLDALALYERGALAAATAYVATSLLLGLAAVVLGLFVGRQIG